MNLKIEYGWIFSFNKFPEPVKPMFNLINQTIESIGRKEAIAKDLWFIMTPMDMPSTQLLNGPISITIFDYNITNGAQLME
ncbi:MAG: hypothetical protein NVS1B13_20500 [Flavisolibacter sp.]